MCRTNINAPHDLVNWARRRTRVGRRRGTADSAEARGAGHMK
jgi:hypothetical protein